MSALYGARLIPLRPPIGNDGPDFEPIASVSLELYAQIAKSLATVDHDLSRSIRLAGDKGISEIQRSVRSQLNGCRAFTGRADQLQGGRILCDLPLT